MKEVSVAVDGEEARISFVDHMHGEMSVRESPVLKYIVIITNLTAAAPIPLF